MDMEHLVCVRALVLGAVAVLVVLVVRPPSHVIQTVAMIVLIILPVARGMTACKQIHERVVEGSIHLALRTRSTGSVTVTNSTMRCDGNRCRIISILVRFILSLVSS